MTAPPSPQRKEPTMLDRQKVFNRVWQAFVIEGAPQSMNVNANGTSCAYRGQNGSKCAVGLLIPDENYKPVWDHECRRVGGILVGNPLYPEYGTPSIDDIGFLTRLQRVHDDRIGAQFARNIRRDLKAFAAEESLSIP
jgi:hypothetical protein